MAVNNILNYFIQFDRFNKLSPCEKFTVGFLSALPALTIVGIIASPFIWKGMVHIFTPTTVVRQPSHHKVTEVAVQTGIIEPKKETPKPAEVWKDEEGLEIESATLRNYFSAMPVDRVEMALDKLFESPDSPKLFDNCYLALFSRDHPQKQALFLSLIVKLENEGRLQSFCNLFAWCQNEERKKSLRCRFIRDILPLALSYDNIDVRHRILDALANNKYTKDSTLEVLAEPDFQLQEHERVRLMAWVNSSIDTCNFRECLRGCLQNSVE